jgi:predicted amidohydrolase YtcJ
MTGIVVIADEIRGHDVGGGARLLDRECVMHTSSVWVGVIAAACVVGGVAATPSSSVLAAPAQSAPAPAASADLLLVNGKIITVDNRDSVAQAVAIAQGRIIAVGSDEAIRALAKPNAQIIDLRGRTATPGLIDTHCHFQAVDEIYQVDVGGESITRMDDVLRMVKARVAASKPGEWVRGGGWDEGKLAERRYVTAADLDTVATANPVYLNHTMGHYGVANSAALKLAGITADTPDPPAGTIDRDASGRPTGVLKESAMRLVTRLIPSYTRAQEREGLLRIIAQFNREGMTAAKDPGTSPAKWELYQELQKEDKLTVRIFSLWMGGRTLDAAKATLARIAGFPRPPQTLADGMLVSGGIKLYIDGSGGARTAWMYDDWNKDFTGTDTGNRGYPTTEPDVYRQEVQLFHDAGLHVSTHAIGDRGIDWVVDTYAAVLAAKPTRGLRHGIIHGNVPTDHAIDTMARLQREYDAGYPETQPTFTWWLGDTYAGNLGPARAKRLVPLKSYLDKGVKWGGGSDYYVTPLAARYGLWASIARRPLKGAYGAQPFGSDQSVDVRTALRSYTIWAAHQLFLEDRIGSIEVGKEADIAVWDRDLYTIPTDDIKNLKCELTLVKGRVVFQAAPLGTGK